MPSVLFGVKSKPLKERPKKRQNVLHRFRLTCSDIWWDTCRYVRLRYSGIIFLALIASVIIAFWFWIESHLPLSGV